MPSKGHALVVGLQGTGRQSLSKLATSLCDHSVVEIEFLQLGRNAVKV